MFVLARQLSGQCWEYEMEVSSILEIPRTEEGGPELIVRKQPLRDRFRNGALPRSGQPVQPVDAGLAGFPRPQFDSVQNDPACSFEATFALPMSKLGSLRTAEIVEDRLFDYQSFMLDTRRPERRMF